MTSDKILERLQALHPKRIDLSLGRIERLLAALGHPEHRLPPIVHVAGTNGKGSTVAFLRAMLEAAGQRVHVYTSPHLVRFHERIRIAGKLIEEDRLAEVLTRCEAANMGEPITFFEITTAAAFVAFSEAPADTAILEVGLGGRLDATNVVVPKVAAITPVSIDHRDFLGDTLAEIAAEKAGILKAGIPAVIGPQADEARAVVERRADEVGAPLSRFGTEWRTAATASGMRYEGPTGSLDLPPPALAGAHQIANAGCAIACLSAFMPDLCSRETVAKGLIGVEWPGRLQRLTHGPLAEIVSMHAPRGSTLWLDGGHNPDAGLALAAWAKQEPHPLYLVAGMLNTKDAIGFFAPLEPYVQAAATVAIPGAEASLSAEALGGYALAAGLKVHHEPNLAAALTELARWAREPARFLICGSLYLAGKVLGENG
ncbi:MAG TPA: folylpolyglutamate synthase/dihydrofolate synthase family protein [Alphaproteobacteria bacterium]|nr:folylpolyglutamate synthase/dihydrofolate synthase family protein [Alphaproteobacteria bacterium]